MAEDTVQSSRRIVEAYLVTCARLGDKTAREHLVARYQARFLRHAYRLLGDAEQARDVVQDGWVEILRGLPKLKDDHAFQAWAFRIITRKCAKHIAGLQKTRRTLETMSGDQTPDSRAEDEIERAADRKPVHAALAKLPAEHRTAIALFYLEEMSVAEVAVALEIPVGTVKSRLLHARHKMRAALEGESHG
ncbi:MAG: sigma-70 family RNA polymerase sigma factor [Rhodospirillales bacterium]|jgi:RNA polymerase sigma factor (sigma-70 family)|nr:sigma-70 family RNA polymerase sigma factor [Rhodospirillales bacterium]